MTLERYVPACNQTLDICAGQVKIPRYVLYTECPVRHTRRAAPRLASNRPGAASGPTLILRFLLRPPTRLLVNLIQRAPVIAHQFELGQDVPDVPLLLHLLVQEPLEE